MFKIFEVFVTEETTVLVEELTGARILQSTAATIKDLNFTDSGRSGSRC